MLKFFFFIFYKGLPQSMSGHKRTLSLLAPKLTGKAQRLYNSLDKPDNYRCIKQQVLYAYGLNPDGY